MFPITVTNRAVGKEMDYIVTHTIPLQLWKGAAP